MNEKIFHLLNVLLQDLVVPPGHLLRALDDAVDVLRRLLELDDAAVKDVVAPEAAGERRARHQREEAEAAADRPRLPLLGVLGVAASCAQVDQQNNLRRKTHNVEKMDPKDLINSLNDILMVTRSCS